MTTVRNRLRVLTIAVALALTARLGAVPDTIDGRAAFDRLKALEGTWAAPGAEGQRATTRFELTAGGSVLVEHYSNPALPDGGRMMTAYHLDGEALVLTHYCIARNQPTLRAASYDARRGEIQFEFVRASNLATPSAGHMRRAMYRLEAPDRFTTAWEFFENGTKTMTETETFTRVK
jgi:hypothetical protein